MARPTAQLTTCQRLALSTLLGTSNVFLTGVAGSGKSHLLKQYLKGLGEGGRKRFPVLASTGAAAILVGGRTFHSFFGLGIMQGGLKATVERAMENTRVVRRLQKVDGVVIDEVSMLSGMTLRAAETIAREARDVDAPWGGMRVIAVGDFAQLPPVNPHGSERDWGFLDPSWIKSSFTPAVLKTIVRTKDPEFSDILNRVRAGRADEVVVAYLREREQAWVKKPDDHVTRLFGFRDTTEKFNLERLAEVKSKERIFETVYSGDAKAIEDLKRNAPIPDVLRLKVGARVMLRLNDPNGRWVNGSLGTIEEIDVDSEILTIELDAGEIAEIEPSPFALLNAEGRELASAKNFPVNLAYATTIHKAQGMT
ncbi:MAG: AAA family ATPase, partial [Bdellovibrionota bacterium]